MVVKSSQGTSLNNEVRCDEGIHRIDEICITSTTNSRKLLRFYYTVVSPVQQRTLNHFHPELEIALCKKGSGRYTVENKSYIISPGDIFVFYSGQHHFVDYVEEGEALEFMGIQFSPQFIWFPENDMFDMRFLNIFINQKDKFQSRLDRNSQATSDIKNSLLQIEDEFIKKLPDFVLMIRVKLYEILVRLNRMYGSDVPDSTHPHIHKRHLVQIESAMEYIDEHFVEDISLDMLAQISNMSRSYFSSMFKALNGITVWDYVINKRIALSVNLMMQSELSITEIAFESGFNNSTNFNRAFQKITGLTPREYRNMLLRTGGNNNTQN